MRTRPCLAPLFGLVLVLQLLVMLSHRPPLPPSLPRKCRQPRHVLVVHELAPSRFAGSNLRVRQICEWLRQKPRSIRVTLAFREPGAAAADTHDARSWAAKHGVELVSDDAVFSRLRALEVRFDLAMLGVWFYRTGAPTISELLLRRLQQRNCRIVLLSDDVHYRRCQQERACDAVARRSSEARLYASPGIELLVAASTEDAEVFRSEFGAQRVTVLPMALDPVRKSTAANRRRSRVKQILFAGSWHDANLFVVTWIMDVLYPALMIDPVLKSAQIVVVGSRAWLLMWEERRRRNVAAWAHMQVIAKVQDMESVLTTNTVFFAPAGISGTGITTKVMFGLQNYVPVVTNRDGLRGFDVRGEMARAVFVAELNNTVWVLTQLRAAFGSLPVNYTPATVDWQKNANWMAVLC